MSCNLRYSVLSIDSVAGNSHSRTSSTALGGLLSSLEKARVQLDSDEEDFGFLADLLKSRELQALVNVHNKVLPYSCV